MCIETLECPRRTGICVAYDQTDDWAPITGSYTGLLPNAVAGGAAYACACGTVGVSVPDEGIGNRGSYTFQDLNAVASGRASKDACRTSEVDTEPCEDIKVPVFISHAAFAEDLDLVANFLSSCMLIPRVFLGLLISLRRTFL